MPRSNGVKEPPQAPLAARPVRTAEDVAESERVVVLPPKMDLLKVRILGLTALVVHAFGSKMEKMEAAQAGKGARRSKAPKDKVAEYNDARYRLPDGRDGVPAVSFKRAMEQAAADDDTVTKSALKWQVFVNLGEELLPILNPETDRFYQGKVGTKDAPRLYSTMARVGPMKVADVRHRPAYDKWAVDVTITYRADRYTREALCNLLLKAGFVGVMEERPSAPKASGQHGMFTICESPKAK